MTSVQKGIDEYFGSEDNHKPRFSVSESVRNATFESIVDELPQRRQEIFEVILAHPNGITAYEIKKILHRSHNSFSGRITELYNKDGKYGDYQFIEPCGVDYCPSVDGKMRAFTIWRVRSDFIEGDNR